MPTPLRNADEERPPSEAVVAAVATAADTSPLDLSPPLYEAVDPEALDSLVRSGMGELRIRFRYKGRVVSVDGNGRIEIDPTDDDSSTREVTSEHD